MSSPETDGFYEIILGVSHLGEVSPSAQIVSQFYVLISNCHSLNNLGTCYLVSENPLSVQIDLSPEKEELLLVIMVNITVNQAVSLVILMNDIEGFSVPSAK